MQDIIIQPASHLKGTISVPGDKSISHRSVMLGSIAEGETEVHGFLEGDDCLATVRAFKEMGVDIEEVGPAVLKIQGVGLHGLKQPSGPLDLGNSGTSMRLLSGVLAGQDFYATLTGDKYLCRRPMRRIINPLRRMGADISGREDKFPPLHIRGGRLSSIDYQSPLASAQVKSAILLAGLSAEGRTQITEPAKSRDHTERMLKHFGAALEVDGLRVSIRGGTPLEGRRVVVPGDFSSAAFFIVAALLAPCSEALIKGVGVNPTRTGLLDVLLEMGAHLQLENRTELAGEPVADIRIWSSRLSGVTVQGDIIPRMIDEFPIFCVACALSSGESLIGGAGELRVKETDRIAVMAQQLTSWGVEAEEFEDGLRIMGRSGRLKASDLDCLRFGDHRISMAAAIAALVSSGDTILRREEHIKTSFPTFFELLERLAPGCIRILSM